MNYVLLFLGVIVLLYFWSAMREKIDKEEAEILSRDGHAEFIRSHYPGLVEAVMDMTGWPIGKERDDAVLIRENESDYVGLLQHSGRLMVAFVENKQLIQQWSYPVGTSNDQILTDISHYVGN